jgi:hypothetical protein
MKSYVGPEVEQEVGPELEMGAEVPTNLLMLFDVLIVYPLDL